jgi:hypothetical protein
VPDVLRQDDSRVSFPADEHPVGSLGPCRAHRILGQAAPLRPFARTRRRLWNTSGSGGTNGSVASSTNIAWSPRFSAPTGFDGQRGEGVDEQLSDLRVEGVAGDGGADGAGVGDAVALAEVVGQVFAAAGVVTDGHPPAAAARGAALERFGGQDGEWTETRREVGLVVLATYREARRERLMVPA